MIVSVFSNIKISTPVISNENFLEDNIVYHIWIMFCIEELQKIYSAKKNDICWRCDILSSLQTSALQNSYKRLLLQERRITYLKLLPLLLHQQLLF